MTGIEEALLQSLRTVAENSNANTKALNDLISKMKSDSGAGGGGGAGSGLAGLGKGAMAANVALGLFKVAAGAVGAILGTLVSIVGKTIGVIADTSRNLLNFAKAAAEGQAKIADFLDAFNQLPFFIGSIFGLAAEVIRYQEGMLDSYLSMTRVGAAFSGSLDEMRGMAMRAGMTLGELTKFTREYSQILATSIGGVDAGLRKFSEVQNLLMGPNSQYAKGLFGLGFTVEEVADILGTTFNTYGDMSKVQLRDNKEIAKAVNAYAFELDAITKLTGKNREEEEKKAKALAAEQAFQYFLERFPEQARTQILNAITAAGIAGGKDMADLAKQQIMTGMVIPITQGQKDVVIRAQGSFSQIMQNYARLALDTSMSEKQRLDLILQNDRIYGLAVRGMMQPFGTFGFTMNQLNNTIFTSQEAYGAAIRAGKSEEEARKQLAELLKKQGKQVEGDAGTLARNQRQMIALGQNIMAAFNNAFGPMADMLLEFSTSFINFVIPIVKDIGGFFNKAFREAKTAYDKGGFAGLISSLSVSLGRALTNTSSFLTPIIEGLKPALANLFDMMRPAIQSHFEAMIITLRRFIHDIFTGGPAAQLARMDEAMEKRLAAQVSGAAPGVDPAEVIADFKRGREYTSYLLARTQKLKEIEERDKDYGIIQSKRQRQLEEIVNLNRSSRGQPPMFNRGTGVSVPTSWFTEIGEGTSTPTTSTPIPVRTSEVQSQEVVAVAVNSLNTQLRDLVAVNREIASNTKETRVAVARLNPDVFQAVG